MGRWLASILLAVMLVVPADAHKSESLKLAPTDRVGAVLLDSPRLSNSYHLDVARLAPDGTVSGFWRIYVASSFRITPEGVMPSAEKKLSALRLKPGRYVFTQIHQNIHWQACLWKGTLAFDVQPGVATYIGEVDPRPALEDLVAQATAKGLTYVLISSVVHRFKDGLAALATVAPTPARISELDANRARLFKKLDGPITAQAAIAFNYTSREVAGRVCA